jgi:2-polyprenyl-3-methyl-5-hydroxy-6-metoxy-1,4-benzoquinol methylase
MYAPSADKPAVTTTTSHVLEQGHYARKQLFSRNAIVAWSHRRRFALARELAAAGAGGALLDYGCGDGTFIALAHDLFRETTGTDVDVEQLRDCGRRLSPVADVRFASLDQLRQPAYAGYYDAVVCMEVLEHCPSDVQPQVLADLAHFVRPHGVVIISVPIEIGPTLAVKQAVRAGAAASGLAGYENRERYRISEFMRMLLARGTSQIERPATISINAHGDTVRYHGHKGFNWRMLAQVIERTFVIERRLYSPVPFTGPWLNSQVWFICRKRQ